MGIFQNDGDVSIFGASFVGCTAGDQAVRRTQNDAHTNNSKIDFTRQALFLVGVKHLILVGSRFVDNTATQTPSALFFSSRLASTGSIIRNTTFTGNAAPGNVSLLAASPLTWDCPLGFWMPSVGQLFGDLPGCNKPCAEGHYGNASDHYTSDCSGPCWPGHFCPAGSAFPWKCPAGTRMPNKRAASKSDCIPCAPGQYQPDSGQEGCLPCPAGKFSPDVGSAACEACPTGGFCEESGAASNMLWQVALVREPYMHYSRIRIPPLF